VVHQVRQVFERLPACPGGPAAAADARFAHFAAAVWPRVREAARGGGQLIYIPSYFDYVRVRNFLRAESASFLGLCEYTARGDMARARSFFADGRRRVLLYTERAQFYSRHRVRGVRDVLFYQLPEHAGFYAEVVNMVEASGAGAGGGLATATALYGRYDALRVERVVGGGRAGRMLAKGAPGTFLFC
jgi:U3 small nucleolar RNA-associated protein 25